MTPQECKPRAIVVDRRGLLLNNTYCRVGAQYRLIDRQRYNDLTQYFVSEALDNSGYYQFDIESNPNRFQLVKPGRGEFPPLPKTPKPTLGPSQQITGTWRDKLQLRVAELMRRIAATTPLEDRPIVVFKAPGVVLPKPHKVRKQK